MDNKTALVMAVLIIAVTVADRIFFASHGYAFLTVELTRLVDHLAFWR
ncbi:MAG: hypothetical protein ACE5DK_02225 [Paracoccaceae bacterium]